MRSTSTPVNLEAHSVVDSLFHKRFGARGCRVGRHRRPTPVYTNAGSSTCVRFISNNRTLWRLPHSSQLVPDSSQSTPSILPSACISDGIIHPHMRRQLDTTVNLPINLFVQLSTSRSVRNKLEVVKQIAKDAGIIVICSTETWLQYDPIKLRRLRTEGYHVLERARPPKPGANLESMRFATMEVTPSLILTELD